MTRTRALQVLGWAHVVGGILGLTSFAIPDAGVRPPDWWYIGALLGYGLSLASGVALLRGRPAGRRLATLVESLQLVGIATPHGGYVFYSGLQLLLVLTPSTISVSTRVQSQFGIGPTAVSATPFLAVDVMTVVAWWLLWRARPGAALPAPTLEPATAAERAV